MYVSRPTVSNLFGTRDQIYGRQVFYGPGVGWNGVRWGWFQDESSTLHLLCTLFLLLLHQLHLRSSGTSSWSLGTSALDPDKQRRLDQSVSQFSRSVVSDSLLPHGLQHARPPCPSPAPEVYSNSFPLSR